LNPSEFAAKWRGVTTGERASAQSHFIDLCRMLGQPTPHEADPTGDWYAFEKGAGKAEGGEGWADVWMRDHFAWEYKGKRKDLAAAYSQLNGYREALGNPPLLVVCDLARFEIHTNFTNTVPRVYRFTLDDLAADPGEPLRILRAVFTDPETLRPTRLREELTERAAKDFADLATALRARGHHPHTVAHFLDRLLFAMFAEDAGILPKNLIDRLASATKGDAGAFSAALHDLFGKMAKGGGLFGVEHIEWFNGGLFDDAEVISLAPTEMETIGRVRNGWLDPPGLSGADLAKRTLTNLYNARPTWLAQAHERLDLAVLAAYGWPADIDRDDLLGRLLALNLARAVGEASGD